MKPMFYRLRAIDVGWDFLGMAIYETPCLYKETRG